MSVLYPKKNPTYVKNLDIHAMYAKATMVDEGYHVPETADMKLTKIKTNQMYRFSNYQLLSVVTRFSFETLIIKGALLT